MRVVLLWIAAVGAAALAAATAVVLAFEDVTIFPLAMGVTLVISIFVGVPIALLCVWMGVQNVWAAVAAGALAGSLPCILLTLPPVLDYSGLTGAQAEAGYGMPTLASIMPYALLAGSFAGFGAVGGLAFWTTLRLGGFSLAGKTHDRMPPGF